MAHVQLINGRLVQGLDFVGWKREIRGCQQNWQCWYPCELVSFGEVLGVNLLQVQKQRTWTHHWCDPFVSPRSLRPDLRPIELRPTTESARGPSAASGAEELGEERELVLHASER